MRWQRAHGGLRDGLFAFLIRSIFLPLDIYHTYVYQRLLMICRFHRMADRQESRRERYRPGSDSFSGWRLISTSWCGVS